MFYEELPCYDFVLLHYYLTHYLPLLLLLVLQFEKKIRSFREEADRRKEELQELQDLLKEAEDQSNVDALHLEVRI